ncbi:hypothetical protein SPBR_01702 [Sporothrix brasiliensis 5110]|uniref:Uncharacterized protein n=1 Tax=Sporothrix brasiliensis 5110 TaxID=1398154 RepID=A0A0C2IW68_9PEZI|nr:uncharacterized protein SPBR_01702 [Sporothrix brasiliensis 5110]KIH91040.1 hypothetical protein SPBR_01702 [Sporothrix brasiliensis 5110]
MANMQYQQPAPYQASQGFLPLEPVAPSNKDVSHKIVSGRKWFFAKAALEGLSIVTGIVVSAVSGAVVVAQMPYPDLNGYLDAGLSFPPGILAILWPVAELVTLVVRRNRGIHPGAHVGMHLVIWLTGTVAGGLIASEYAFDSIFTYWPMSDYRLSVAEKTKGYAHYVTMELVLCICLWPLVVVNMILFVRACIECHRRNMRRALHRANKRAMLIAAQAAWATGQAPGQVPYQTAAPAPAPAPAPGPPPMNAYQQYPMAELDKTGTPKPQASTLSNVSPVQSPFQSQHPPTAAELAQPQPHPAHLIHEIGGGAAQYPEMPAASHAPAPARVEMPADGHHEEVPAVPAPEHHHQQQQRQQTEPYTPVTETQQVARDGDAESARGQRSGPPQYVMIGGTKVRYYEF